MDIKLAVKSLEELDESIRHNYVEKNGMFTLKGAEGFTVEHEIGKLVRAYEDEKAENKELRAKARSIKDEYESKLESMENATPDEKLKAQYEAKIAEMVEAHQSERGVLESELEKIMIDENLMKEYNRLGGIPERAKFFIKDVRDSVRIAKNDDGSREVIVANENGAPRFNTTTGSNLTLKDYLAQCKENEEYQLFFKSETKSGTGTAPGDNAGIVAPKTMKYDDFNALEPQQRAVFMKEGGTVE